MMKKKIFTVLVPAVILLMLPDVTANEDNVIITKFDKEIDKVFFGEETIYFKVTFGRNYHNYSFEARSPLFKYNLRGMIPAGGSAGEIHYPDCWIDPDAAFGNYSFAFFLNYTTDNNIKVSEKFNFTLQYIKSIELKDIHIPEDKDRNFSVTLQIYMDITELKIEFDGDGDIEVVPEEIVMKNVTAGIYTYDTVLYRGEANPGDKQEVGYWITANIDSRKIQFGEKNIHVMISWENDENNNDNTNSYFQNRLLIISVVVFLIILVMFYFYRVNFKKRIPPVY